MRFLFLLLISISSFGQSTFHSLLADGLNFFVSEAGSGTENGTSPANAMAFDDFLLETINPDTRILFNRGDEFNFEEYDFTVDVKIGAYGSGDDPVFLASEDISGLIWTDTGGDIYTTPMVTEPKWVWIAGECAENAQTTRVTVSSRGSATTATVPNGTLDAYTSIVGAYVVIKEKLFQNSIRLNITAFNKTTDIMTFSGGGSPTTGNIDLVVYNDTEFLAGNNEWVWSAGTLYVKAAASPSTLDIRKSDFIYGIKTTEDIAVDNIEFKEYYTAAIWTDDTDAAVNISNCSFHDIRDVAILIERETLGSRIADNTFERIGNNGVLTRAATDIVVTGNTFTDIGMQTNYGWQTWSTGPLTIGAQDWYSTTVGCAFAYEVDFDDDTIEGSNVLFDKNVISNVAYCGFNMGLGAGNTVTRNLIDDFTNRFTDGGGIYTFHYRDQNVGNLNNDISYNIISNNNDQNRCHGIYLDNRTSLANVHHNTIYDVTVLGAVSTSNTAGGILFNFDTETNTAENNNIFNCDAGIIIQQGTDGSYLYDPNVNNQVNENTIASKFTDQFQMFFEDIDLTGTWNPYSGTGGADNNYYDGNVSPVRPAFNVNESPAERTLAQLQADFGEDAASILRTNIPDIVINATAATSNEDAQSDYIDLTTGSTLTTYTIDPYYSKVVGQLNYSNTLTAASSQYFNAGTTGDIQFTNASHLSIFFWFKVVSNPGATQFILSNQNVSTSRGYGVAMTTSGTFVVNLINTVATNRATYTTAVDVADNAWHSFLFTYQGVPANGRIFIDGADVGTVSANNLTATIANTDNLLIGALTGPSNYFNGLIDEVAIWNSGQAANQTAIYNGGRPQDFLRTSFMPLHYWKMGKTASLLDVGTSATDLNLTGVNSPTNSTDTKQ